MCACDEDRSLDGDRADNRLVLQQNADHQEDNIEKEHDEAQQFAHFPLTGGDGDDDEDEHDEEQHDGTEQTITAHPYWNHIVYDGI